MPKPEVIGDYIHIRVKDPDLFVDDSFRTIDISTEQGIKAVIGKLKTEPEGNTIVQKYMFDKDKWTVERAQAWVDEHKGKSLMAMVTLYKETDLSGDNKNKKIKFFPIITLSIDKEKHIAKVRVSNEDLDRDHEILLLSGWKEHRKYYDQHPVLVSSHQYDKLTHQIGEAVNIDWDKMEFDFKWYVGEGNPEADWGWKLAEKGKAMFSVGFHPHKILEGDAIPEQYRDKEPRRVFTDLELLEVSQVIVGSNRGALQLGYNPTPELCQYAFDIVKSYSSEIPDFESKKTINKSDENTIIDQEGNKLESKNKLTIDNIIPIPQVKNLDEYIEMLQILKSGRIISAKNRTIIQQAIDNMKKAINMCNQLLEISEPTDNEEEGKEIDYQSEIETMIKRMEKFNR